jgi:RNA polymerase sigma-70 factor (ECF subfamily)
MYEEKSTEQIAAQVGLSENATRQLIFRARAAFKKALIGDVDTSGMSAAAILSVAARKAASEGKKVGAAALTMIALVVMSLTVFPGLNRANTDQMAEGPVNSGMSQESEQAKPSSPPTTSEVVVPNEDSTNESNESPSAGSKVKPSKEAIEAVLEGPALGAIMNADSKSKIFVLDQDYTAVGDNGLTAKFTFNPTSEAVFSEVSAQIKLGDVLLDFTPTMPMLIEGKNADGLQTFIFEATVPSLFDESGQKWSDTVARNATFKLEVIMDRSGSKVSAISLAMLSPTSK